MVITQRLNGLSEIIRKASPELVAGPLRTFLKRSGQVVLNRARQKAPMDTGRLRADLNTEMDKGTTPMWTSIGTTMEYAPYMEMGTGLFAEDMQGAPKSSGVHYPPAAALEGWAARHGFGAGPFHTELGWRLMSGGQKVAYLIARRGGLLPRRFLRNALNESLSDIQGFVKQFGRDVKAEWEKK